MNTKPAAELLRQWNLMMRAIREDHSALYHDLDVTTPPDEAKSFPSLSVGDKLYSAPDGVLYVHTYLIVAKSTHHKCVVMALERHQFKDSRAYVMWADDDFYETKGEALIAAAEQTIGDYESLVRLSFRMLEVKDNLQEVLRVWDSFDA